MLSKFNFTRYALAEPETDPLEDFAKGKAEDKKKGGGCGGSFWIFAIVLILISTVWAIYGAKADNSAPDVAPTVDNNLVNTLMVTMQTVETTPTETPTLSPSPTFTETPPAPTAEASPSPSATLPPTWTPHVITQVVEIPVEITREVVITQIVEVTREAVITVEVPQPIVITVIVDASATPAAPTLTPTP